MSKSFIRVLKRSLGLALACAAVQGASAFSLFGPAETWQDATLDYLTRFYYGSVELGAPKNFGEGSRLTTPVITYGYDISFLTYFGAKGVAAVDSAMNLLNALPPASSANLSKFLMQGNQQINYSAQALGLRDLKSTVLQIMMEHMGLAGETHVWDLHTRNGITGPPPCLFEYLVINRNFDPKTFQPNNYVNGVQYGYNIWDGCSNSVSVADAIESTVDAGSAAGVTYTAVSTLYGLQTGGYFLGLSYDDMGGLKYLYNKNNMAFETLDPNSVVSSFAGNSPWEGISSTNGGVATGFGSNFFGFAGGVEKITYVKLPSSSLLGGTFTPRTFNYTIPALSQNGTLTTLHVTRTVIQPDIIFSAADLVGNTEGGAPFAYTVYARGFTFINPGAVSVGGGVLPQVISPQETVTFNNITPIFVNESPSFLTLDTVLEFPGLEWGSFDGSTNAPVVYPNGSTLQELEAELFNGSGSGPQSTTWLGLGP